MLSGASDQHDIAIALIVVFGTQACIALAYLLYKNVGSPASLARRLREGLLKGLLRRRESADAKILYQGAVGSLATERTEPPEGVETDIVNLKKLMEQAVEKLTEVNTTVKEVSTTVKEVKTTVKDSSLTLGGVSTKIDEASTKVGEASTKIDVVTSGVTEIQAKLDKAGHATLFWNISSLLFGIAGLVIGILTLNLA